MLDKQRVRSFLLGGAAGLLAGILFAPKSGREFRGTVADRAGEARERGRETYFEARERLRERLAEAREESYRSRSEEAAPRAGTSGGAEREVPQQPVLRDVSRDAPGDVETGAGAGSEDLRGRVREIRARLRRRAEGSGDLGER